FFQAEDGIRDFHVTGVQTCALPIYLNDFIRRFTYGVKVVEIDSAGRVLIPKDLVAFAKIEKEIVLNSVGNFLEVWDKDLYEKARSEERRVGKECRTQWMRTQ